MGFDADTINETDPELPRVAGPQNPIEALRHRSAEPSYSSVGVDMAKVQRAAEAQVREMGRFAKRAEAAVSRYSDVAQIKAAKPFSIDLVQPPPSIRPVIPELLRDLAKEQATQNELTVVIARGVSESVDLARTEAAARARSDRKIILVAAAGPVIAVVGLVLQHFHWG